LERSGRTFDAAFFNHVTPMTFLKDFRRRVPTVLWLDATPRFSQRYSKWYQKGVPGKTTSLMSKYKYEWTRRAYTDATFLLTWSNGVKNSLVNDYQIEGNKIKVILPGINLGFWTRRSSPSREKARSKQRLRVLFVGEDFIRKGGDLLLKISRDSDFQCCEFHFVTNSFSGEPSSNTFVHGNVKANSEQMLTLYQEADIAVLPTRADFFPLALCEAMAMELPIIASNVGNIHEIVIDGKNGFLIPADDERSLSDRLRTLVTHLKMRKEFGRNGRKLVESNFDLQKNAEKIIECLKNISDKMSA
jgi:glycosyltransferase involved in cell wall biosynthesis